MPNWVTTNIERKEIINRKNEIITVGRLEKQKNFKYLIEEFSNTDNKINIIGEGSLKTDLKKLSQEKNMKSFFLEKCQILNLFNFCQILNILYFHHF